MAQLNFDAREVKPSAAPDPIPAGKYLVEINESEMKETKNKDGSYLELVFTVVDGEYRGRKLWDRLCINHPNAKTVEIARANLSAICHSVGVLQPQDSVQLHGLPLCVRVILKEDNNGEKRNEIKGYYRREDIEQPVAAPQAPVGDNTAPWKRG